MGSIMCEYPGLFWSELKACCTDMITWMSTANTDHDDARNVPVHVLRYGTVSHWRSESMSHTQHTLPWKHTHTHTKTPCFSGHTDISRTHAHTHTRTHAHTHTRHNTQKHAHTHTRTHAHTHTRTHAHTHTRTHAHTHKHTHTNKYIDGLKRLTLPCA